jgi:DNA-binding IclR family transcriptional regulator
VLWRKKVSYLYFQTPDSRSAGALVGRPDYPAEDSVVGKVLLAEWSNERVREHFPDCHAPLCRDLAEVREYGYARIDRPDGETGLAVPVGSPAEAGLAFSGYFDRRKIPSLVRRLKVTAAHLDEGGPLVPQSGRSPTL